MSAVSSFSFPVLNVRGSHYDIGYHTGSTFRERIKLFYQKSELIQGMLLPFYAHRKGREIADVYLRGVQESFPKYIQEIKGTAEGVGVPFEDIFLLNIAKEIYNCHFHEMPNWSPEADNLGCSGIMINTEQVKMIAHNEDCDPQSKHFGYFVHAQIKDETEDQEFTVFSYPGSLPGNTFAFNKHGMIFCCNGLYPKHAKLGSTPRFFLNRAMMSATSAEHAKEIGRNKGNGCAFGFNLNLGNWKTPEEMWALEIGPGEKESVANLHTIPERSSQSNDCSYVHTNHYKHIQVEEMENLKSTIARMERIKQFKSPSSVEEVKIILGDTKNNCYPIYRTPRPTDGGETVATAIFDLLQQKLDVYVDNTKFGPSPLFTLPLI